VTRWKAETVADEIFRGRLLRRGADGYEPARRAAVWNERKPDRYPDAILLVKDEGDVVAGVCLARDNGWTIGIRSGGCGGRPA
jgi:FAD/FMN-containing dehydrogenase